MYVPLKPPYFYPQQQLFANKLTHYPQVIGRKLRYQYANLSNSWNTRGLQWVKPLRLSCLIRFIFRVKGQPNTIIMLCNFQVTLHSRMTFTNLVECSLVRVLHYSLLHSRVGSQKPLIMSRCRHQFLFTYLHFTYLHKDHV